MKITRIRVGGRGSFAAAMINTANTRTNNPTHMNTTMKNKVQLIGNLGGDPELKAMGNGQHMLRMSLATNERYKGADGEWKSETQWHPVVVWGKQAERLAGQVRKGSGLVVEGRLVHRRYETKEGEKRFSTEVVLNEYQLLASPAMAELN
jgi:single-strand DNA-binding protein